LGLALLMRLEIALHKRLSFAGSAVQQAPLIFFLLLALGLCAGAINLLFALPAEFFFGLPALLGALLWAPLHFLLPRQRAATV